MLNQVYANREQDWEFELQKYVIPECFYRESTIHISTIFKSLQKKGVFNYIKEELFPPLGDGEGKGGVIIPRKYFSGGEVFPILKKIDRSQTATSQERAGMVSGDLAMESVNMARAKKLLKQNGMNHIRTRLKAKHVVLLIEDDEGTRSKMARILEDSI